MTYDWRGTSPHGEATREWFEEIDRRLFDPVTSFFAQGRNEKPFSRLIPYSNLKGKEVLEVGCGSGAHARLIAECGARLTAIDLTARAVELTKRRLSLYGLVANVRTMDAERMGFETGSFDFIWSWGVIHHSAKTERAVAEFARVLRPGGEARVMVYHRHSINVFLVLLRGGLNGRLWKEGVAGTLNRYSDGLIARYMTAREARALFQRHFAEVETRIFGQKNELLPVPGTGALGRAKATIARCIPDGLARAVLARFGGFLFVIARKP